MHARLLLRLHARIVVFLACASCLEISIRRKTFFEAVRIFSALPDGPKRGLACLVMLNASLLNQVALYPLVPEVLHPSFWGALVCPLTLWQPGTGVNAQGCIDSIGHRQIEEHWQLGPTTALHCTACRDGSTHANFDFSMQTNATGWGKRVASRLGLSGWQLAGASGLATARRTLAREELRGQVGNLRQDINTSAATLDKAGKKKALELGKKFYAKVCTRRRTPVFPLYHTSLSESACHHS